MHLLEHRVDVDHRQVREALHQPGGEARLGGRHADRGDVAGRIAVERAGRCEHEEVRPEAFPVDAAQRSEEYTSELQSLMRISYAVFCLKKKTIHIERNNDAIRVT